MIDYRKFLSKQERIVLPYFQGPYVEGPTASFRVSDSLEPGFYLFEIRGRVAKAIEPANEYDLTRLNKVRGHLFGRWIVREGARTELLYFLPEEKLPRFSPLIARRWHSGELIFESMDFDSDAEDQVRRAYEDQRTLSNVAGVPATLRAAFAFAVVHRESANLGFFFLPIEVRSEINEISEKGSAQAVACLRHLQTLREAHRQRDLPRPISRHVESRDEDRAGVVLRGAGARLCSLRHLAGDLLEVRYEFLGSRFGAIVRQDNLQVEDAGICLDGADRELTLESLPGVIREAMETDQLVVTWYDD